MKTTFKASNFNKPTPSWAKKIGNVAIYSLPLYISAIMASPMSDEYKLWANFILTMILVSVKTVTKLFTVEDGQSI